MDKELRNTINDLKKSALHKQRLLIFSTILFFIAIIAVTYSWLSMRFSGESNDISMSSIHLGISYRGTSPNILANLTPGETVEQTFEITNYSDSPVVYNMYWDNVVNTFADNAIITYSLFERTLGEISTDRPVPSEKLYFYYGIEIGPQETQYFSLTVTYEYKYNENQFDNIGMFFSGEIHIDTSGRITEDYIEYFADDQHSATLPNLNDYYYDNTRSWCTDSSTITFDPSTGVTTINDITPSTYCRLYFNANKIFAYTATEQEYTTLLNGQYELEAWGAQGGSRLSGQRGGYGGYSRGIVSLEENTTLYINVGGGGNYRYEGAANGGYNGGGTSTGCGSSFGAGAGGGATHIALSSGLLSSFDTDGDGTGEDEDLSNLLIAAGGGGGGYFDNTTPTNSYIGGAGGGAVGGRNGGGQTGSSLFGQGATSECGGGGGGFYGGSGSEGAGGSGYIGNPKLKEKYMYCSNTTNGCSASSNLSSLTYTTAEVSRTPISNTTLGNANPESSELNHGYARIKYIPGNVNVELTVYLQGGIQTMNYNGTYVQGSSLYIKKPFKEGHYFDGWIVSGIGSSMHGDIITFGMTDVTLTAKWQPLEAGQYTEFAYNGSYNIYTISRSGYYKVELWGAQGGSGNYGAISHSGGLGAYTSGIINAVAGEKYYIYVGGKGQDVSGTTTFELSENGNGYNGGAPASAYASNEAHGGGGGATDIRYFGTTPGSGDLVFNSSLGLNSRIMVAGGGGGGSTHVTNGLSYSGIGGAGGNLMGGSSIQKNTTCNAYGMGGTQIAGGTSITCETAGSEYTGTALFGIGKSNVSAYTVSSGGIYSGGGGGYYGGGAGKKAAAGGGSSYISGYSGVISVESSSDSASPRSHDNNQTKHYSNKFFVNSDMIDGINSGNGKVRITYLGTNLPNKTTSALSEVRYIKDCMTRNNMDNYLYWNEIQAISNGVNVAKGASVEGTLKASSSYPYTRITDGLISPDIYAKTASESVANNCVTVDLGNTFDLDEIAVWHMGDLYVPTNNITYVSGDGTWWRPVINTGNIEETSLGKRVTSWYNINPVNTRLITNYIRNANFTSAEGWTTVAPSSTSIPNNSLKMSFTDNTLYINDTSTTLLYWNYQYIPFVEGHVYYMADNVNMTIRSSNYLYFVIRSGSTTTGNPGFKIDSVTDGYQLFSTTFTATADYTSIQLGSGNSSVTTSYHQQPRLYDLTAIFGAGNEPNVEWCDANLPFVDGTVVYSAE